MGRTDLPGGRRRAASPEKVGDAVVASNADTSLILSDGPLFPSPKTQPQCMENVENGHGKSRRARFSSWNEEPLKVQARSIPSLNGHRRNAPKRRRDNLPDILLSSSVGFSPHDDLLGGIVSSMILLSRWPLLRLRYKFQTISGAAAAADGGETDNRYPWNWTLLSASSPGRTLPSERERVPRSASQVRGLYNYGQTCYLNTVLQAMASLEPFIVYLERLVQILRQRHDFARRLPYEVNEESPLSVDESLSSILLNTLLCVNGMVGSSTPDVRQILQRVGSKHAQFRAAGRVGLEQQDAEELLQNLINMMVGEAEFDLTGPSSSMPFFPLANEGNGVHKEDPMILSFSSHQNLASETDDAPQVVATEATAASLLSSNKSFASSCASSESAADLPVEEKKQEDSDVYVPRVGSEDNLSTGVSVDRIVDVPAKLPVNVDAMSDISSRASQNSPSVNLMMTTTSSISPSPVSCWVGSALRCKECGHLRPIQNQPFNSIPVIPTAVSKMMQSQSYSSHYSRSGSVAKGCSNNPHPACTLEECLLQFTCIDTVREVECRRCTLREKRTELTEDLSMYKDAINSLQASKKGFESDDLDDLRRELQQTRSKLRILNSIDPNDDTPLDSILAMDEFLALDEPLEIKRGESNKRMMLTRLPAVLTIHVQRRYYDAATDRMRKTAQHVIFPEMLDVAPYCAYGNPRWHREGAEWVGTQSNHNSGRSSKCKPIYYRLAAVIEHQGDAFLGHYVCYRRGLEPGSWYYTSDQTVRTVSWKTVSQCQAYLLFYEAHST